MLPTRLNLLLPAKRRYLKRMIYVQFTKGVLEIFLITVCLSAIVIIGGRWLLQSHFNELAENIVSISGQHVQTNDVIRDINSTVKKTQDVQKNYTIWTPLVVEFMNLIPDSSVLTSIDMNMEEKKISISGTAEDRESLLLLQEILESSNIIKSAPVPISQLTTKESIPFSITAMLE